MGYTIKWVEDNLGITRKAIINYEKKGLMKESESRNPKNNYREYNDEDIHRLWTIKLLQGVGYSVGEIKRMFEDPNLDFHASIATKVTDLEAKREEINRYIDFAKTIKITGLIPSVRCVGSIRYEDFARYAQNTWNFNSEPGIASLLDFAINITQTEKIDTEKIGIEQIEQLERLFENFQTNQHDCTIIAYYNILSELRNLDYKSEAVQTVVNLLYKFVSKDRLGAILDEQLRKKLFVQSTISSFVPGSDIYILNKSSYGKEACQFIAEALAFFGGYETLDEFYKQEE